MHTSRHRSCKESGPTIGLKQVFSRAMPRWTHYRLCIVWFSNPWSLCSALLPERLTNTHKGVAWD